MKLWKPMLNLKFKNMREVVNEKLLQEAKVFGKKIEEDFEKLAEENISMCTPEDKQVFVSGCNIGYNKAKENLFTLEQVMEAMLQISKYYADNLGKDVDGHKKALEIIQSLKQPKKD